MSTPASGKGFNGFNWVFPPKNRGKTVKPPIFGWWLNNGSDPLKMDDLGVTPTILGNSHIFEFYGSDKSPYLAPWDERNVYLLIYHKNQPFM